MLKRVLQLKFKHQFKYNHACKRVCGSNALKGDSAKLFLFFEFIIHSRIRKERKGEILVPFSTYFTMNKRTL